MNNTQKNSYVKAHITAALLALLEERELKDISVRDITAAACVSRVSFYRNYREKEDILRQYIGGLFGQWTAEYDAAGSGGDSALMGALFGHLSAHKEFYLLLKRRGLAHLLKNVILDICGPKPEYPNADAYAAAFVAYGIYGWIEEWFARGMQESAQEITQMLQSRRAAT
ncbi:MAG: TetR/AcrR family transcriptional regulator [Ruthenibacterium sp.]